MNEPITSLTSFKRRLASTQTVTVINHTRPKYSGARRILEVGATVFYWEMAIASKYGRCRSDIPKAAGMQITSPDEVTFMDNGAPFLTFIFDNPQM